MSNCRGIPDHRCGAATIAVGVASGHIAGEDMARCMRAANAASAVRSETPARWCFCNPIFERLAQDFEDLAPARGPLIPKQEIMMRQRHLSRQGQLAAADQTHLGDGVVGSQERARGDDGRAPAGEAGDARDTGGLPRCRQAHRRQEGGEAPRQPRFARARWSEHQEIMARTPVWPSASASVPRMPMPAPLPRSRSRNSGQDEDHDSSSNSALASYRSAVSNLSVNQP